VTFEFLQKQKPATFFRGGLDSSDRRGLAQNGHWRVFVKWLEQRIRRYSVADRQEQRECVGEFLVEFCLDSSNSTKDFQEMLLDFDERDWLKDLPMPELECWDSDNEWCDDAEHGHEVSVSPWKLVAMKFRHV